MIHPRRKAALSGSNQACFEAKTDASKAKNILLYSPMVLQKSQVISGAFDLSQQYLMLLLGKVSNEFMYKLKLRNFYWNDIRLDPVKFPNK